MLVSLQFVASEVTGLKRTAERSEKELEKLGAKVDAIEKNLASFEGTTTTEIKAWKKVSGWAFGAAFSLLLGIGAVAALTMVTEGAQNAKIDNLTKVVETASLDRQNQTAVLQKAVTATNASVKIAQDRETKLNKIYEFVTELERTKGESRSEFMAQRTMLTKKQLATEHEDGKLLFKVPLPYISLSAEKPPRPSATLINPHDSRLDFLNMQIKVVGMTNNSLEIAIAADPPTLSKITTFLNDNGIIPLELLIRMPK